MLRIIGPDLYSQGGQTVLQTRVATIFPAGNALVTLPGTHATQREAYVKLLNEEREQSGQPLLSNEEVKDLWHNAVDLIVEPDAVLIRPDPEQLELVFAADELLQGLVSKLRIRFLLADTTLVHDAVKRRGQCWRITPEVLDAEVMATRIRNAKMRIGGRPIYYYSAHTGTRLLTIQALRELSDLDDSQLRAHLLEIRKYCRCKNRKRNLEVDFFLGAECLRLPGDWSLHLAGNRSLCLTADESLRTAFAAAEFEHADSEQLRCLYGRLCTDFAARVPAKLRVDDLMNDQWRLYMWLAMNPLEEDRTLEEQHLELAPEFHNHVQWLPGGEVVDGQLIFDSIIDEAGSKGTVIDARLNDHRAREILFNFVRDYGNLEYINVGRIVDRLSLSPRQPRGRREVYVVEMKQRGVVDEIVKIVRLQKWDASFRLDQGKSLLQAMVETEHYTEYTQDRYLGARRLGMNLNGPVTMGKIGEQYQGKQSYLHNTRIWIPYFQRGYVRGIATDKMPREFYEEPTRALRFAELLGRAAASNLIVGRGDRSREVFFDDGDEIIVFEKDTCRENRSDKSQSGAEFSVPVELVVTDHTGSFWHFEHPLAELAEGYARPVNVRFPLLRDRAAFASAYLNALRNRLARIQRAYRDNRAAYADLFHFRNIDKEGNFAYRWQRVLKRLDETDIDELEDAIWQYIALPELRPIRQPAEYADCC